MDVESEQSLNAILVTMRKDSAMKNAQLDITESDQSVGKSALQVTRLVLVFIAYATIQISHAFLTFGLVSNLPTHTVLTSEITLNNFTTAILTLIMGIGKPSFFYNVMTLPVSSPFSYFSALLLILSFTVHITPIPLFVTLKIQSSKN